jgi:hypothetical protein
MKYLLKTPLLVALFLFAASLKSGDGTTPRFKHTGYFTASMDGRPFDTHNYQKYTAEMTGQSESSKADQNADITFYGAKHIDRNGNAFVESLKFNYLAQAGKPGEISAQKIVFDFDNHKFTSVPGQTKFTITKAEYNSDRTSVIVSATFEAKMAMWVAPGEAAPIIKVKGRMEDINISVPTTRPMASAE